MAAVMSRRKHRYIEVAQPSRSPRSKGKTQDDSSRATSSSSSCNASETGVATSSATPSILIIWGPRVAPSVVTCRCLTSASSCLS